MDNSNRAAIGFRAHSGWAALVVVAGDPRSPSVLDRRRIELADPSIPGSIQPYHAAEPLPLDAAEKHIHRCADQARLLALGALRGVLESLEKDGHKVAGCAILLASGRPATTLAATLASHALIHTAEGELFREALRQASAECRLPVTGVKEREVYERAAAALRISSEELSDRVAAMGRALGPPWRQDEKLAAAAAWLALA